MFPQRAAIRYNCHLLMPTLLHQWHLQLLSCHHLWSNCWILPPQLLSWGSLGQVGGQGLWSLESQEEQGGGHNRYQSAVTLFNKTYRPCPLIVITLISANNISRLIILGIYMPSLVPTFLLHTMYVASSWKRSRNVSSSIYDETCSFVCLELECILVSALFLVWHVMM